MTARKAFWPSMAELTTVMTTTNKYDGVGRLTSVTDLNGKITTNYDPNGNLLSTVDTLGRVTSFVYDTRNRRIQTLYDDGSFDNSLFDGAGRTVAVSTPRGSVYGYRLDPTSTSRTSYREDGFVDVVIDPANCPMCDLQQADMNDDGFADGRDLQLFVNAVLGG